MPPPSQCCLVKELNKIIYQNYGYCICIFLNIFQIFLSKTLENANFNVDYNNTLSLTKQH